MRLLVIGEKNGELVRASKMAADAGGFVVHAENCHEALLRLRSFGTDAVLIDVALDVPGFIAKLRSERILTDVFACGLQNNAKEAAAAMRAGALQYVPLPPDAELIAALISGVANDTHALIYRDPSMGRVIEMVDAVAPSDASILITGPSGAGKEIIARAIHKKSKRALKPLVAINCAAIPEALLESELFGHEKGAFTGAVARRIGKFEEANGGTLLLDEISEMDVRLQAKLLRAIQERCIDRIGGTGSVPVNIRILATSNRDLAQAVKDGTFREDLYFRLNVVNICLPPLKDRPLDIEILSQHFAHKYASDNGLEDKEILPCAMDCLTSYSWPGNVRELENMIHRAVLLSGENDIGREVIVLPNGHRFADAKFGSRHLVAQTSPTEAGDMIPATVGQSLNEIERSAIVATLTKQQGDRDKAARILGISIRTMSSKLRGYREMGLEIPSKAQFAAKA